VINPYIALLDVKGVLVVTGQVGPVEEPNMAPMIFANKAVAGSLVGGIADTQEVLDFCAKHNIHPKCKIIPIEEVNKAFEKLEKGEMDHRFVIDMASMTEGN
jgi:uncharacterized zinc-type alcohol dehydrogenase-like protein